MAETTDVFTFDAPVPSKENETQIEGAEYPTEKETLRLEVEKLKAEVKKLKYKQEHDPVFDIDDHKRCDRDISFYIEFANHETMVLCFNILKPKLYKIMRAFKPIHTVP